MLLEMKYFSMKKMYN